MSEKKEKIFSGIWNELETADKNKVVVNHLKTLPKWDLKRILCDVLFVDNYMDDETLRKEFEGLIYTR